MRILVVEDDEMTLDLICNVLEQAGYETETARNGREALEILRQGICRLVISDWGMPEMSGLELCEKIRNGSFGFIYVCLCHGQGS